MNRPRGYFCYFCSSRFAHGLPAVTVTVQTWRGEARNHGVESRRYCSMGCMILSEAELSGGDS